MSRAEHDAMVATGRVQPTIAGVDMKHVTVPPDPNAFSAALKGSLFVEFDIIDAQTSPGGKTGWVIVFGSNSTLGKLALQRGQAVVGLPRIANIVITEMK